MNDQRGFTLIELLVTISIMAILLGIGVPSFRGMIEANRLSSASNDLLSGLQFARSEAIKRGIPVVFCSSSDQSSCAATPAWIGGRVARNQAVVTDPAYRIWPAVRAGIAISDPGTVEFNALGAASDLRCFDVTLGSLSRSVSVEVGGRIASATVACS
jgi:type IV fimbrial biogenesis protein FimT